MGCGSSSVQADDHSGGSDGSPPRRRSRVRAVSMDEDIASQPTTATSGVSDDDELTDDAGPPMMPAQDESPSGLVGFRSDDSDGPPRPVRNGGNRWHGTQHPSKSPTSILLKSSTFNSGNNNAGLNISENGGGCGAGVGNGNKIGGRRRARFHSMDDVDGSVRSSSRNSSSGSRSSPVTRFLGIDDDGVDAAHRSYRSPDDSTEFSRIQDMVARMNKPPQQFH